MKVDCTVIETWDDELTSYLDEGESSTVVRDGEAQRILGLVHLYLLFDAFHVSEDEVLQTDLTSEQLLHVNFVCVQGAKQDL